MNEIASANFAKECLLHIYYQWKNTINREKLWILQRDKKKKNLYHRFVLFWGYFG